MDVPFSSSGAMSRAHYALVRKIEAATPHAADQLLLAEVDRIRHQLGRSTLTMKQSKESLILLLYCAMTVNPGVHVDLEFALPHAINLAEAGQTVQDKRTGYLFCAEVMPPEHELQLMLVNSIRKLLTSDEPNSLYLFVNSLASVDPKLWAGTDPAIPAVLEEWEVERVMKLLESEDKLIRKQTLQTLWRVDPSIVESYYARVLQGELPIPSEHFLPRLFEILDVICGNDGEAYAHQLKNALKSVEGDRPLNKRPVLQDIVEESLTRTHSRDGSWRSSWIGVLFTTLIDQEAEVGPTLMVILTALLCEYSELSPISPIEMLRGLAERMPAYSPAIQDVCLVTMLRLAGACEEVPAPVQEAVNRLHAQAGRHIQRRCDLFNSLVQSKDALKHIITDASSSSLPDFAVALEKYATDQRRAVSRSPSTLPTSPALKPRSPEPSSSRTSPTPSKLRYAAYDPPRPTHRLRRVSSGSSRHSDEGSVRSMGHSRANDDPMTMTVTPGDLTLAAQTSDLRSIASGSPRSNLSLLPVVQILDEDASAPDLIALDSPFIPEPTQSIASTLSEAEHDFESTWNALESSTSRGWCEASIDTVLRKLQALHRRLKVTERDRSPFEGALNSNQKTSDLVTVVTGDLKIVVCPDTLGASPKGLAAIRLKESDDDSCLWWLRCEDEELRNIIKATLR
ncbi:hypothetical protein ACG7TL_003021 [Trametes sanguinea]